MRTSIGDKSNENLFKNNLLLRGWRNESDAYNAALPRGGTGQNDRHNAKLVNKIYVDRKKSGDRISLLSSGAIGTDCSLKTQWIKQFVWVLALIDCFDKKINESNQPKIQNVTF